MTGQSGTWKNVTLPKHDEENFRFKVKVIKETALAFYVSIDDLPLWVPKSVGTIGLDPSGRHYSIDLPPWFVNKNSLDK